MNRLSGKKAFVTAAGQGIGRAIAERFIAEGAEVVAADLDPKLLANLSGAHHLALDATDAAAVRKAATDHPDIDILVNAVGFVHAGTILDCDEKAWTNSFRINVDSMYLTSRAFLPGMLSRTSGVILNIASVASSLKAIPNRFVYSTTKAAVIGLTKAIAADFVGQGVRCNAICPGTVETPSLHERLSATGDFDAALEAFRARQPMGRLGKPEEISALAAYLASDEAAFTTGQAHIIDGGWAM
jgi:2-keto-3-deoxy-L-fuconate dehydrogenase